MFGSWWIDQCIPKKRARLRLHSTNAGLKEMNKTLGCKKNDFRELQGNESGTFYNEGYLSKPPVPSSGMI